MKNKKKIILLIFIVGILLLAGIICRALLADLSIENSLQEQMVNGRYYYVKTKTVSLSNLEHNLINNTYKKVYNDKYFKQENTHEKWEDLKTLNYGREYKQHDIRNKTTNKDGKLIFDKAFIGGDYFTCTECSKFDAIEEEINGSFPIDSRIEDILKNLDTDPWRGSSKEPNIIHLFDLQLNHNYETRKKLFTILKYVFWDDINYLGAVNWEGRRAYGFRFIDKSFASILSMYFDTEELKYIGQEHVTKKYTGNNMGDILRLNKTVVLNEEYSDSNFGLNSDGLSRESEGEINQMLDKECSVDFDCDSIIDYTTEPGSCFAFQKRCVNNQCALMCEDKNLIQNGSCTKYIQEKESFITYICLENDKGVSRLIKESDSEYGICKVSNSDKKIMTFYKCIDNEDGEIELLEQINK